jgi:hypothetical protein
MKYFCALFCSCLFVFYGCEPTEPNSTTGQTAQDSSLVLNQVYSFYATTDKAYCSADSIIPSDCAGGQIMFTPKGNVLMIYYCLGNDSDMYTIGTYKADTGKITCSFNRSYTFPLDCYDCEGVEDKGPADPNKGVLKNIPVMELTFSKLACPNYDYHFSYAADSEIYILEKSNALGTKEFKDAIATIQKLSGL